MKKLIALVVMTSLPAQPLSAGVHDAAFSSSADRARAETSVFVGLNYGVSFDRGIKSPEARASFRVARMVKSPNAQFRVGEGLGVSAGTKSEATFLIGGHEIDLHAGKANLSSAGTIAIVAVGVLAIGAVAAYYALRDPCDHKECE